MDIKEYLNTTSEISNRDRLICVASVLSMWIVGMSVNSKLSKANKALIKQRFRIMSLEVDNYNLRKEIIKNK